jgi:osomolarity two-component system, sensor histidine kinase CHK1
MGGKIWVESEEGRGTQFHFTMFLNTPEDKGPDLSIPTFVAEAPPERRRCLIIEHSPIVRNLLVRDIGGVGLQESAVSSIAEAQTCFQLNSYSIVVVDGTLRRADEFVKGLATSAPDARVIVTSLLGTASDLDEVNVVSTLIKPIRRWRLFKALETALSQSPLNMKVTDFGNLHKETKRRTLASMGFRHPLRILVRSLLDKSNIQLAEDNPVNTKVALQYLKRMGYTADHAKDGLEVLELCERAALADSLYDVILLDVQMPNMDVHSRS